MTPAPDERNAPAVPADDLSMGNARVDTAATIAAREGAAGITPAFENLTPSEQGEVTDALEMNNSARLLDILRTHARTLTRDELLAILAE